MSTDVSSDLSLHGLIGGGGSAPSPGPTPWVRPSEWPVIDTLIGPTDDKMVAVFMVPDNTSSSDGSPVAIRIDVASAGTYDVDWGDGTTDTGIASNAQASHIYDPTNVNLTSTTYGYKCAVITITASDDITEINFKQDITGYVTSTYRGYGWLDIDMRCPSLNTLLLGGNNQGNENIQQFNIRASSLTSGSELFRSCTSLVKLKGFSTSATFTNMSNMFSGCNSLQEIPQLPTSAVTTISSCFDNCFSLYEFGFPFDLSSCTTFTSAFNECRSLTEVTITDCSSATALNSSNIFQNCFSLEKVTIQNLTSATSIASLFLDKNSLKEVTLTGLSSLTTSGLSSTFSGCGSLINITLSGIGTGLTSLSSTFSNCYSLVNFPVFNTSNVTTWTNTFNSCRSMKSFPAYDTSSGTSWGTTSGTGTFNNCFSLQTLGGLSLAAVTSSSQLRSIFFGCYSLIELPNFTFGGSGVGTSYDSALQDLRSCQRIRNWLWWDISTTLTRCYMLGKDALEEIFTQLPTVTGTKNFNISACRGRATANDAAAVAKGWTVVT